MEELYSITVLFSPYKESDYISIYYSNGYDKTKTFMKEIAIKLYNKSKTIQNINTNFFDEYDDYILFGENYNNKTGYYVAWGMVKIEKIKEITKIEDFEETYDFKILDPIARMISSIGKPCDVFKKG